MKARFFEAFPLTNQLLDDSVVERLRELVNDAQDVRASLVKWLIRAHDDRKQGGLALADAESSFWTASEAPFLDWLDRVVAVDERNDEAESRVEQARHAMHVALRRTASDHSSTRMSRSPSSTPENRHAWRRPDAH